MAQDHLSWHRGPKLSSGHLITDDGNTDNTIMKTHHFTLSTTNLNKLYTRYINYYNNHKNKIVLSNSGICGVVLEFKIFI